MYQKYVITRIRAVLALLIFFVIDLAIKVSELIILLFNHEDLNVIYLDIDQPFPILFSISGIIGAGVYLFFIDYYESENLPLSHLVVFTTILSAFLTFNFLKLYNTSIGNEFSGPSLTNTPISFDFFPAIMITYLLIITYPKLWNLIQTSEYEGKTRALKGLIISMVFLFISPSIFITIANFMNPSVEMAVILGSLIPRITVAIGNVILLLSYGRTGLAHLHSQRLEKLLAITKSGTPIYSLDFIEKPTKRDDVLISGSLAALSGLLAESIEVTDLESIEFKEKEVLISHQKTIGFFLITDRPSQFVKNALNNAATELLRVFDEPSQDGLMTQMIVDQNIDHRMKIIFGIE